MKSKPKSDIVRTSITLPRKLHRQLREVAARKGCSARQLILDSVARMVAENPKPARRRKGILDLDNPPIVPADGREPFDLTSEQIYDLIGFP